MGFARDKEGSLWIVSSFDPPFILEIETRLGGKEPWFQNEKIFFQEQETGLL
ncbi:MAG: hypothetical protein WD266_13005 [Balneolales bacterium]